MAQENPFDTGVDGRIGGRLFRAECGRCHGRDAKGNDETSAPDLTTGRFRSADTDKDLFNVIRDGIDGTTMIGISWAQDQEIWQVVTYLNSLSVNPADIQLTGNATEGKKLFNGKGDCNSCHMVKGKGGRLGPDLSIVANRRTPDELKSDLLKPSELVEPRWWTIKVTLPDGTIVQGLRMDEDTFTIRIMDEQENLWHFDKSELKTSQRIETSIMPSFQKTFTENEVDNLIAYLFSLRIEG